MVKTLRTPKRRRRCNVKHFGLDAVERLFSRTLCALQSAPRRQFASVLAPRMNLIVRTTADALIPDAAVRREVQRLPKSPV